MRKIVFLFFITLVVLGCSTDKEKPEGLNKEGSTEPIPPVSLDLDKILKRGYINAAVNYSSTTYFVYRGAIMGFEYELLRRLEEYFQIKVNIIVQPSIEASIRMLNKGEVDIIALPLTITKERKKVIAFTDHYISQPQVLVQRKPKNWRDMKLHEIDNSLIRDQVGLIGKEVHVLNHSSYIDALESLSEQIGGDITIIEDDPQIDTDQLIRNVATEVYEYTISDENIAKVNKLYYPILDIETPVSFPRRIAWAVRLNSPLLLDTLSRGISVAKRNGTIKMIYDKYFNSSRKAKEIAKSEFTSFSGSKLSPYDDLIKSNAVKLDWDWRLLAAMVYQESKFDPNTTSWAGAQGLLQMMPATAKEQGVTNRKSPVQSLNGGTRYLLWLEKQWQPRVEDLDEQLKFIMASYNVGLGHVFDAQALTEKFGGDPKKWLDVRENLLKLSNRKYFSDPVVKVGYARGSEPVEYVDKIMERYERYKQLILE